MGLVPAVLMLIGPSVVEVAALSTRRTFFFGGFGRAELSDYVYFDSVPWLGCLMHR